MCSEHGVPEAECAVCKPELAAKLKSGESMKVRLPSTNSMAIVGIQAAPPERGAIAEAVECVAEVSFNQNKLAQIAAPVKSNRANRGYPTVLSHQTLDRERKLREQRVN